MKDLSKKEEIQYLKKRIEDLIVEADEVFDFNTLIIDESQDISEKFWEFFTELVIAKNAKWVVCYDKNQGITHLNWRPPEYLNTPQLVLNTVIRSTKEIAKTYSVPLVDLDLLVPKTDEFIYDTTHFNEAGSKLVADFITQKMLKIINQRK